MSLLIGEHLRKSYGGNVAVVDVSFELRRGEMLALIGPNGAGKSTLFGMIGGQVKPDHGRVLIDGLDVSGLAARQIWRAGVGRTFQVAQTFGSMSVLENVQMALIAHEGRSFDMRARVACLYRPKALELLDLVGMADMAELTCAVLAYGDVKRLELALALASRPRLLLMDEPTAGMAGEEREALMQLTRKVVREQEIGVLFTEHDMGAVFGFADRIMVIVRGEIIASGTPEQVAAHPQVREGYLGRGFALRRGGAA